MRTIDDLNIRIILASSIWGFALGLGYNVLVEYLSGVIAPLLFQLISRILGFLFMMLYPLLVSLIMRRRTSFWINPLMFSMSGSMLGFSGLMLARSLLRQLWSGAAIIMALFSSILIFAVPKVNTIPVLEKERKSHPLSWEELNSLSLLNLMFLQVPFLPGNAR
jgi:hypothetical protein